MDPAIGHITEEKVWRPMRESRHYHLRCPVCGDRTEDDGITNECRNDHEPALLHTCYTEGDFRPQPHEQGIYRYRGWLPVGRSLPGTGRAVAFRGERLGRSIGLPDLWLAFSGYWPEKGADLETVTFKDLEACTVIGRLPANAPTLVLASAGNTAAAFAAACTKYEMSCLLIVPESGVDRLTILRETSQGVRLVVVEQGDYADAIALSEQIGKLPGFTLEGGAKNVGRRDGLGTVMLTAFEEMGRLPDYYFQAVGSGTGAIAAHEAALRLAGCDARPPRLMLGQNAAFAPLADAWRTGRAPGSVPSGCGADRAVLRGVVADELTNRRPPYAIRGGVRDALVGSGGDVLVADATATRAAMAWFHELEGIDVEPAAGVALACLRAAVRAGRVAADACVLLNVTGGGRARARRERPAVPVEPALRVRVAAGEVSRSAEEIAELCFPGSVR
jgi:cysteate synthase